MKRGIVIPYRPLVIAVVVTAALDASGCGKKGPPLPPLTRTPVAPSEFSAERRADHVELHFVTPAANTDGTRPANIERVEVYALTASAVVPPELLLAEGKRIARVAVKGPRDPNDVIGPDDSAEDLDPLVGQGLDQGIRASVGEELAGMIKSGEPLLRIYAVVGISRNGRRGLVSSALPVRLSVAPPLPALPSLPTYTETAITVTWPPANDGQVAYHVYDIIQSSPDASSPPTGVNRLTTAPVQEPHFVDTRMDWGAERCYAVRAVETTDGLTVESDQGPTVCVTLKDTFPPAPPSGLETGSSPGAVNLIWDGNKEKDLAGYYVLRGEPAAATLTRITGSPIQETSFTDTVMPGARYVYAVEAVDKANNVSQPSGRKEETAR